MREEHPEPDEGRHGRSGSGPVTQEDYASSDEDVEDVEPGSDE